MVMTVMNVLEKIVMRGPWILSGFLIGMVFTVFNLAQDTTLDSTLRDAGIERVVRCNNAHSNWVEIVWIEDKRCAKEGSVK